VKPVYEQAKKVAVGDATTLAVKRDKLFKRFASMGVEAERVLAALKKQSIESVDLEDLSTLIGIGTAIKEGELTIDDAFAPDQPPQPQPRQGAHEKILAQPSFAPAGEPAPAEEQPK
jgi:hypothetical protein